MLSRIYYGVRCDLNDLEGAENVMHERVKRGERAEFHAGIAAALSILSSFDLRDQSEFVRVLDEKYNESANFYTVEKEK